MAILPLVIAPDERLKTPSAPVKSITEATKQLVADMFETMYAERGIGLSAVQVGVMEKIITMDVEWKDGGGPGEQWVMINAEIVQPSDEQNIYKEGCLSFPDQFSEVERPKVVRVKYQDLDGNWHEKDFDGLLATCVQHEIDHTNGITFVDHISRLKRDMILNKLRKLKKAGAFDHDHHDHVHDEHCNHG